MSIDIFAQLSGCAGGQDTSEAGNAIVLAELKSRIQRVRHETITITKRVLSETHRNKTKTFNRLASVSASIMPFDSVRRPPPASSESAALEGRNKKFDCKHSILRYTIIAR